MLSPDYWNARNAAVREAVGRESAFKPRVTGELNWNYAVIERMHPTTQAVTLIPFNLAKAVLQRDPSANLVLEPGDVVTVFGREDLRQPVDSNDRFVRLKARCVPGLYRLLPGETARQLVKRLGGVTPNAYLFGAELTRASALGTQQNGWMSCWPRLDVQMSFETVVASRNNTGEAEYGARTRRIFARICWNHCGNCLPPAGSCCIWSLPIGSVKHFLTFRWKMATVCIFLL